MNETKKKRGGVRAGAGRPKGRLSTPDFLNHLYKGDLDRFVKKAFALADAGDTRVLLYVLDQAFGKPKQNVGIGGTDGGPLLIEISEAIAKKRSLHK